MVVKYAYREGEIPHLVGTLVSKVVNSDTPNLVWKDRIIQHKLEVPLPVENMVNYSVPKYPFWCVNIEILNTDNLEISRPG